MHRRYLLRRLLAVVAVLALAAAIAVGGYFGGKALFGSGHGGPAAAPAKVPAPRIVVRKPQPQGTADLGFPAFATRNTTRIGGADPVADAAGAALAAYPSAGVPGPAAVSLVRADDWRAGIAAASLAGPPVGAPVLISGAKHVPGITSEALTQLAPAGSPATSGKQVFAIGKAAAPGGMKETSISAPSPAALAAQIARLRDRLAGGKPQYVVVASLDDPGFAMPAAAWAARSGDPVLFAGKGPPPVPTLRALHRERGIPVYVLGPPAAVSNHALKLIRKVSPGATRIAGSDPVANSIAFARYHRGDFGWNVIDPGHGLVIANAARPLDAAAAAPLSATGTFGPLLVTTSATSLPAGLRGYLLDLKPGYVSDPTRGVFNHVWLIGDAGAISVGVQAKIDRLVELVQVRSSPGGGIAPPAHP